LLSLIGTVYSVDCTTYLATTVTPCVLGSTPCQCWNDFLVNQQSQCTVDESVLIFEACKSKCNAAIFNCTAATCLEANLIFTTCAANLLGTGQDACECFKNYRDNTNGKCVSKDDQLTQVAQCAVARGLCPTENCTLACDILNDLIPDTKQTFETCWTNNVDKCACYTATADKIVDFDGCNLAASLKLETCVQTQLDCDTLQGDETCKATDVTLSIATIKALVDANVEKFRTAWNNFLSKLANAITIDTVAHESDGNTITFTLTVTYTGTDVQTVINECIHVFTLSIGLKAEDMQGKEVQTTKRGLLSTSTVAITGKDNSSGASGLTIMLLPVVALISAIHYYF